MDYDDWLYASFKKYKNLSMYDLHENITAMDWVDGKSLCIATTSETKHEIVELLLPGKMLESEKSGKLQKDRDFRVITGGFCSNKVDEMKHIPKTRYCIIAEHSMNGVSIWEMGDHDTDLMKQHATVPGISSHGGLTRISTNVDGTDGRLAFGSCLDGITVVDVNNFQKIGDTTDCAMKEQLTALFFNTCDVLTCCTRNGDVSVLDLRCKKVKVTSHKNHGKSASFWTMTKANDQSECLLQMSSGGEVLQVDTRCLDTCVVKMDTGFSTGKNFDILNIQGSPEGGRFSISGFDGMVHIFQHSDQSNMLHNVIVPVFSHEGHVMNTDSQSDTLMVVKHMWHPWQPDLIISCATDSSLHAWQYSDGTT